MISNGAIKLCACALRKMTIIEGGRFCRPNVERVNATGAICFTQCSKQNCTQNVGMLCHSEIYDINIGIPVGFSNSFIANLKISKFDIIKNNHSMSQS